MSHLCKLDAFPEYPCYPTLAQSTAVNALLQLKTVPAAEDPTIGPRPPFELALVLDISGSMSGDRINSLRLAAVSVVNKLGDDDIVHIIVYDSEPEVLASNAKVGETRDALKCAISGIVTKGTTNISGALEVAKQLFLSGGRQLLRRIFLYSDGEPNVGLTTTGEFQNLAAEIHAEAQCEISTFGIGEGIDASIMKAINEGGHGHYDFVTPRRIAELTERAISGMVRLLGTRAELVVQCPSGVTVRSFGDDEDDTASGQADQQVREQAIDIGNIKYDWGKRLLLRLSVANGTPSCIIPLQLMYVPASSPLAAVVTLSTELPIHFVEPSAAFAPGARPRNPEVARAIALRGVGNAFNEAAIALEEADVEKARTLITEVLDDLVQYRANDPTGIVETQLRRGQRTLQRLQIEGARGARRAELELGHQAAMLDRSLSDDDFAASRASNHSVLYEPDRDSPPPGISRVVLRPFGSMGSDDEDIDDDDEEGNAMRVQLSGGSQRRASADRAHTPPPIDMPESFDDTEGVPEEFFCPLTRAIMREPVITEDGQSYDRPAIENWFAQGHMTSPLTNAQLPSRKLTPNYALRSMIDSFLKHSSPNASGSQGAAAPQ